MDQWRRLTRRVPTLGRVIEERDQLREENRRLRRQVERATRPAAGSGSKAPGAPAAYDYVFIVAYGRSGSTLLQGVLNSIPGYLIRGENRSAVYHLYQFHRQCVTDKRKYAKRGAHLSSHPFYGIGGYPGPKSLAELRGLVLDTVLRPQADTRVTGFKEIRWYQPDVVQYVDFLCRAFPGARFIVNTRNHQDVLASAWWAHQDNAAETLQRIEEGMLGLADHLGEAAYRVHYDDYATDPAKLTGLFDWLGESYDQERVAQVLEVPHAAL